MKNILRISSRCNNMEIYDLAIIGAGPAGLSASVYASRYGIKNIIIGAISGGAASQTHEIGNWLGTPNIAGWQFAKNAMDHAKSLEAEIESTVVDEIKGQDGEFEIFCSNGKRIKAKTILLTMGSKHRHLGVSGEREFYGKGVSYCATCDGFFYRGKTVAVVGGNDSAAGAAAFLGNIAEKVYVIYRKDKLRCENFWMNAIEKNPKVHVLYNTNIKEIRGGEKIEEVVLDNPHEGSDLLKLDGLFVEIGAEPNVELVKNLELETDEQGYIKIESDGKTSKKGIWAAGDITTGSNKFKQIVTAAAEGAIAANSIQMFLKK
jgi:thioredoxin reductase (NADPH)